MKEQKELARANVHAAELMAIIEMKDEHIQKLNQSLAKANARGADLVAERELQMIEIKELNLGLEKEIQDHKQAEEALRKSEGKFRFIFDSEVMGIIFWDLKGNITDANEKFFRMVGYTKEDLLSGSVCWEDMTPSKYSDIDKKAIEEIKQHGIITPYEKEYIRKDGARIPVILGAARLDGDKEMGIGFVLDITERKKAEKTLKNSEERLKILFEYAPDGYYLSDLKGNFIDGNKAAEELTGYKREELIGKSMLKLKLLSLKQIPKVASLLAQNVLGKPTGPDEFIINRKDSTHIAVEIRTYPVKIKGRTYVLGNVRDITERKKAEEALRKSEEKYRVIFESIHDVYYRTDKDEIVTLISPSVKAQAGWDPEEIIGHPVTDFYLHPGDREMMMGKLKKSGVVNDYELKLFAKDGSVIETSASSNFVFDKKGNTVGVEGILRNITERKKAEEALQRSEERLLSFMNSASDSFYLFDPDLNFVEINKKGMETMGMKKEEAIGKHIAEIIPDVKESGRYDKHLEVLRTGKPFRIEHHIPHPQFGDKHFILKSFKVGDGLGVIATDITEQWKAEEKIKKSLEEKEVLINEIHHRVKNNMQIITSLLRIQAGNITDEKIQDVFNALHDRIKSMSILYQMLYQSNDLTRVDLSEYIRNLTAHLVSMYRDRVETIDLKLNVKDVYLDIKRTVPCGLIITELVSNSLKHAFSGVKKGEIAVEMFPDGGEKYALTVRDSGKGFPEGLDYRETPSLGMKLVVDLVKQLEGTIELNPSKGTEFKIVF